MSCLFKEGENQCVWWVTRDFNSRLKSYCLHPNVVTQTKIMCDGCQVQYSIKPQTTYTEAPETRKLEQIHLKSKAGITFSM